MSRNSVRVAVHDACFCFNTQCPDSVKSVFGEKTDFVDCCRRDCDNHKRGSVVLVKMPNEPPFELPKEPGVLE